MSAVKIEWHQREENTLWGTSSNHWSVHFLWVSDCIQLSMHGSHTDFSDVHLHSWSPLQTPRTIISGAGRLMWMSRYKGQWAEVRRKDEVKLPHSSVELHLCSSFHICHAELSTRCTYGRERRINCSSCHCLLHLHLQPVPTQGSHEPSSDLSKGQKGLQEQRNAGKSQIPWSKWKDKNSIYFALFRGLFYQGWSYMLTVAS